MNQDIAEQITVRDHAIACLENEIKIKDELIAVQKNIIRALEDHNAELTELMERILRS